MAIELIGLTIARSLAANSGAAGVYSPNLTYAATAVGRKLQEVVSVRDYGALGDGLTDDTAAIQNAINTVIAGNNGGDLYFPAGTYIISSALTIPFSVHWRIRGAARGKVTIKQKTDNTPIFNLTDNLTWGWRIEELTFAWANNQPATNTSAIAIWMSGGNSSGGYYNFQITRCIFSNGFRGISGAAAAQSPLWGAQVSYCIHYGQMSGAFFYAVPSPAIGQPNINICNCYLDAAGISEPLINISAGDTISMNNIEILNGNASQVSSLLFLTSCYHVTLNACKSEQFICGSGNPILWNFPGSQVNIINCGFNGFTGTGNPRLMQAQSGGSLAIMGLNVASALTSGQAVPWYATTIPFVCHFTSSGLVTDDIRSVLGNVTGMPSLYTDAKLPDAMTSVGDASVTLTSTSDRVQRFNTTQTAARTITLPGTSGMKKGMEFEIVRDAATPGPYVLNVSDPVSGINFVFQPNETGMVRYRFLGTAWMIASSTRTLQKPVRVVGGAVPAVVPDFVGQTFIDATNKKIYVATGTSATTDWTVLN